MSVCLFRGDFALLLSFNTEFGSFCNEKSRISRFNTGLSQQP